MWVISLCSVRLRLVIHRWCMNVTDGQPCDVYNKTAGKKAIKRWNWFSALREKKPEATESEAQERYRLTRKSFWNEQNDVWQNNFLHPQKVYVKVSVFKKRVLESVGEWEDTFSINSRQEVSLSVTFIFNMKVRLIGHDRNLIHNCSGNTNKPCQDSDVSKSCYCHWNELISVFLSLFSFCRIVGDVVTLPGSLQNRLSFLSLIAQRTRILRWLKPP